MKRFITIFNWEILTIFKDKATLLLLIGAAVLYSFLYGYLYGPQVVKEMPIGVIDNDNTTLSHEMIRAFDATEAVSVAFQPANMREAEDLLMQRKISGIINIPCGLEANSYSAKQSHVGIYCDGSYFLHYSALVNAASSVIFKFSHDIQMRILTAKGQPVSRAEVISNPVKFSVEKLYNPSSGYATSLMPAVMMIIIQQTLLIIIGMIIGTQNEFKLWRNLYDYSTFGILTSKILAYVVATIPQIVYLFGIAYKIFDYPMRENIFDLIAFFIPYVLSVICLGISIGAIFNRREASMLYLAPLSVCFLLWSGVSWPEESMPTWLYTIGLILPSSSGIKGLVALRTSGVSLSDISDYYGTLWLLTAVFFTTAYYSIKVARRRSYH